MGTTSRSTTAGRPIPELVYQAAERRISGPVEPVLCFPTQPVVLVEGHLDAMVLTRVSQQTCTAMGCKFLPLTDFDPAESSAGADSIIRYLKRVRKLIKNRPKSAPLMVLFDWEIDGTKLEQARRSYGDDSQARVLAMNPIHADPRISPNIKGIERFYPKELFESARVNNVVDVAIDQDGNVMVEPPKLKQAKGQLAGMLCDAQDSDWYRHLEAMLQDVEAAVKLSQLRLPMP